MEYIVDSCPVILAKGPRSGHAKVARELCEKSYNSSRDEWYCGLKLHAVVARRPGRLPLPLSLMTSGVAVHDLPAAKQLLEDHLSLNHGRLYADKTYMDTAWAELLEKNRSLALLTPRKKQTGDVLISGDTFSSFVSSIRQPVECFFNWLNRLTNIQATSLVRSLSKRDTSMIKSHGILSKNSAREIEKKRTVIYGGQGKSLTKFLQEAVKATA